MCTQSGFLVNPKEVKQDITLEEVSTANEIPEKVDTSLEDCKGVGPDELREVLPYMKDNHHGTVILLISKILSCITSLFKNTTFNVSWTRT